MITMLWQQLTTALHCLLDDRRHPDRERGEMGASSLELVVYAAGLLALALLVMAAINRSVMSHIGLIN